MTEPHDLPVEYAPLPRPGLTGKEFFRTLTGYDELAVLKAFKTDLSELRKRQLTFMRALVFVAARRAGLKDALAYQRVMDMPFGEVEDIFDDEPDDEPAGESEAGKGSPPSI